MKRSALVASLAALSLMLAPGIRSHAQEVQLPIEIPAPVDTSPAPKSDIAENNLDFTYRKQQYKMFEMVWPAKSGMHIRRFVWSGCVLTGDQMNDLLYDLTRIPGVDNESIEVSDRIADVALSDDAKWPKARPAVLHAIRLVLHSAPKVSCPTKRMVPSKK